METIAMYWEPRIKTYGFQVEKGLALHKYVLSADLAGNGSVLSRAPEPNRTDSLYSARN